MMQPLSLSGAYKLTIFLLGIGSSIKAMETLRMRDSYGRQGIFNWRITGNDVLQRGGFSGFFDKIYGKTGMVVLSILVLVSFGLLLAIPDQSFLFRLNLLLFLSANLLLYYRQSYGLDGADQMSLLITLVILLCYLFYRQEALMTIGLIFIGSQVALSYFVSGVAKLISPQWRSGLAIEGIWSTYTYGSPLARRVVFRSKAVCRAFAWSTIAVEMLFPLGLLLDSRSIVGFLVAGFLFHVSIAVIMGLNDFVWAFVAGYPSFYYLSRFVAAS